MIPGAVAPEEPPIAIARETEIFPGGASKAIGTAFLRNGACPLACVYCALYRQASPGAASGAGIARQIRSARARLGEVAGLKLYNGSSLFEPRSIRQTAGDLAAIAAEVGDLELVVVESRSEQAGRAPAFRSLLRGGLEVAIGLEVADDALLRRLGKPTSIERFRNAARELARGGISLRAFVLVQPPFVSRGRALDLALETFRVARDAGARVVSLLPVVSEHEPMERLRASGDFAEIELGAYFDVVAACAAEGGPIVLAELGSLARLPGCASGREARVVALARLNATGALSPVSCACLPRPGAADAP
jgi:radical SAM enzyme (TIGR01210 family)